ncbi:hypothetical protein Tco_0147553, partial [Tanacetum coccineum]
MLSTISMLTGELITGVQNVRNSTDMPPTWSHLKMSTPDTGSLQEGDFKRLHRQDIKDMLLLLVQDKLTNLNLEERHYLEDEMNRNCLMCTDEFHKFGDGTLNHVCTALNDIAL